MIVAYVYDLHVPYLLRNGWDNLNKALHELRQLITSWKAKKQGIRVIESLTISVSG